MMVLSRRKRLFFCVIVLVISIFIAEFVIHGIFYFLRGRLWFLADRQEVFNVRNFTELVHDDRIVTNRSQFYGFYRIESNSNENIWLIETDVNRFRVGVNQYFIDKKNIAFLGDSVPFGWGVDGNETYPSYFYQIMQEKAILSDIGVINAAIPSYSLYQAVQRYKNELLGKYNLKLVFLQVYDPVSQFVMWGRKWDSKMSWSSRNTLLMTQNIAQPRILRSAAHYSGICYIVYKIMERWKTQSLMKARLDLHDKEALKYFKTENLAVLEDLLSELEKQGSRLVLISVNPKKINVDCSRSPNLSFNEFRYCAILYFNEILRTFAQSHSDVSYIDIHNYFLNSEESDLYIDSVHLSPKGAKKEAKFLFETVFMPNGK